ncbi:hypothetical protein CRENBAI_023511 [Crenichthys baileyi]|uniref:Uncharacterized protein n=1 Tax=Crenichthys baileyi TaxID=28760 RepID=A0AAV9S418_9TELE
MPDMDFTDNHGVVTCESRKKNVATSTSLVHGFFREREQFGGFEDLLPRVGTRICASGTPTTGDAVKPARSRTRTLKLTEPAASSPQADPIRHQISARLLSVATAIF